MCRIPSDWDPCGASSAARRPAGVPRGGACADPQLGWPAMTAEPRIMGILNVTPDSFSDGGRYLDAGRRRRARRSSWPAQGAAIVDVGGESTRPGAEPVGDGGGAPARRPGDRGPRRRGRAPRRSRSTPRRSAVARAALDAGASVRQRRHRVPRRARRSRSWSRARRRVLPRPTCRASPRTMQDDAALRRRRRRGDRVPRASASRSRSPRASRASGSSSIPGSASARPSSTTSSCSRGWTSSPCSACRS